MERTLRRTDAWPVEVVGVGITSRSATLARHGATTTTFPLASVTKLLTAYAVLLAAQDGLLHLDEPAGPDGASVRHLLAHASGLPPSDVGPTSRVGTRRIYSNLGYRLLGELVEQRTGTPFGKHLRLEVLAPLGMTATALAGSPAAAATGTVDDLLAFARELLAPQLLDEPLATAIAEVQFPGLGGVVPGYGRQVTNDWGLGPEIRDAKSPHWTGPSQPAHTFGHFGQSGSFLWVDRDAGIACAYLGSRAFDTWAVDAWAPFNDAVYRTATGL